jgi:Uma2 family endonuclease
MQTLVLEKRYNYKEFRQIEFSQEELDGYLFELIDGNIMKQNFPSLKHQNVVVNLIGIFRSFLKSNPIGSVLCAPFGVFLNENTQLQPDIIFVGTAQKDIAQSDGIYGVPDLLIEVMSPSSMEIDRFKKFEIYEQAGVAEYWLIDPNNETIEVYINSGKKYKFFAFVSATTSNPYIKSKVISELQIHISEVFEKD